MILRKPYAILIKYFRTIHILMFVFFMYLVFSLRKIYVFFSSYIKAGNFTYLENMSQIYVPWILFLIAIILLALSIGIFLLMHKKEKPVLFYRIMIGYCVFLLIIFIYFSVFFKSLDNTVYETLRIVANRDISLFAYLSNFFFVFFSFIRGFGFDIKKFSFDKDKRELNLEESDSEEYELNVNIEKADVKSFLNKQKRELKYYFTENKKFFILILSIAFISISLYFAYSILVVNKIYHEGDNVDVGIVTYRVNNSRISNVDKYGKQVDSDYDYLIIDLNISLERGSGTLDGQALRVHIDDEYYYPVSSSCDLFSDIGSCYNNQELKSGINSNFIFVYKIKKDHKIIYLELLKNRGNEYKYSKVELSCMNEEVVDNYYRINESFVIDGKDITLKSYKLSNKDSYNYEECIDNKCSTFVKKVIPNTGEMVLSLTIEGANELSDDFVTSAFGLSEKSGKKYVGNDIKYVTRYANNLYYSVPSHLKDKSFNLIITTRTMRYNIVLEEE